MQNIFLMVIKQIQNMHFHVLKAAYDQGARWIVLCDTNGGTLTT
jgi:isopropylmalate/homocitrate/citramalate synthase